MCYEKIILVAMVVDHKEHSPHREPSIFKNVCFLAGKGTASISVNDSRNRSDSDSPFEIATSLLSTKFCIEILGALSCCVFFFYFIWR